MTIKPDRWIRRMAQDHGMIEPFVDHQMRSGVISYGVSSYGYDIRVADDFKVFTNVYNTVVDPKKFDPRSFVDIKSEYCDIPPNSFALARSVELLRIPRNVACVVIGKSTYARCFAADTPVALVDGTAPTLVELAERAERGEPAWGYALGQHGNIIVTLLEAPRCVGQDSLLEVTLDTGETIKATPDHLFILRDGTLAPCSSLRPGTALMPLYTELFRGYEGVYQPLTGHYIPTHRLADEWNVRNGIYEDVPQTHRHHIDHNRTNNNPWNLMRVDASEHIRYHNAEYYDGPDFNAAEHSASIRAAIAQRRLDPAWEATWLAQQQQKAMSFWHSPQYAAARAYVSERHLERWADPALRQAQSERMLSWWDDDQRRAERSAFSRNLWAQDDGTRRENQREIARQMRIRPEIDAERVRWALDQTGSIRGAARLLNCDRSVFRRFPEILAAFRGVSLVKNHKVVSVRELPGTHDVYCLTVPEAGNFALGAGVFVKNCGIIINVTPLEPSWEGYITIEISNTTPLPARIYANEGIGQVLFFESDEECEVSYADKAGKYQGQVGVVLPRIDKGE